MFEERLTDKASSGCHNGSLYNLNIWAFYKSCWERGFTRTQTVILGMFEEHLTDKASSGCHNGSLYNRTYIMYELLEQGRKARRL